jgi:predicted phosphohydrolase
MALFTIADPHLGFGVNKPMNIFGSRWHEHERRLADNWLKTVGPDDTVVIPGDISWAMQLADALPDLRFLNSLPGHKILSRGNHDYWWTSLAKLEKLCRDENLQTLSFLRNNGLLIPPDWIVCGTRGWILPDDPDFSERDETIYLREAGRLRLSLEAAAPLRQPDRELIVCLHYPPYGHDGKPTLFTEILEEFSVDHCVFGHIHSISALTSLVLPASQVRFSLASADFLDFKPLRL